jgi:hypothetical protein
MNTMKIGLSIIVLSSLSNMGYAAPAKKVKDLILTCPSSKTIHLDYKIEHPVGWEVDSQFEQVEFVAASTAITSEEHNLPEGKRLEILCHYQDVKHPSNIVELTTLLPEGYDTNTCTLGPKGVLCR